MDKDKKWYAALAVGLINDTFERVGNSTSAGDGHFGVTGWQVKHLAISKGKATFRYVGKSGVSHEKVVTDALLVKALKKAVEGKKDADLVCGVTADEVNEYLDDLGLEITAKDIRGLHANREMQKRLKAIRSKGGKLPKDKKERDKKLKAEFKEALEAAAEVVGHEPSTLKSQYLVPAFEQYVIDGTIPSKFSERAAVARLTERYLRNL